MDIDLTDTTWTGAERTRWRQFYTPLFAGISLAFCLVAQYLYFKFPRLLKFPRCLLSWLNFYNMYYCIYVFLKWLPVTPWHKAWATKVTPGGPECMAGIWLTLTQMSGPVAVNLLVCLTIFLVTVRRVNIENSRAWFWGYVTFAFVYPFVTAFPLTFAFSKKSEWQAGASCAPQGAARALSRIPNLIFWVAQIVLIAISTYHIRKVLKEVHTDNKFPARYVIVRFLAVLLSQVYTIWPSLIIQSITNTPLDIENAVWQRFANASHFTGPMLDAIVMILGNQDFIDWFKKKYFPSTKSDGSVELATPSTGSVQTKQSSSSSGDSIIVSISDGAIEMSEYESHKEAENENPEAVSIFKSPEEEGTQIID